MDDQMARGVHVTPGAGVVARLGSFVAYARGDDDGINKLIVRLNALADAPWREVVRTITSDIAETGYDAHPEVACASVFEDRIGILVFGDLELIVEAEDGERLFAGRDSSTWIDLAVRGTVDRVRCGEQSDSNVVGVLRDGVVPGGGFLFDRTGPIPAARRWVTDKARAVTENDTTTETASESDASGDGGEGPPAPTEFTRGPMPTPTVSVVDAPPDLDATPSAATAPADPADRETTIPGVICAEGHLTNPTAFSCHRCGAALPEDAVTVDGPRPALGRLTFDDGAVLELDRPVVIGSDVPPGYTIDGEPAIVVELENDDGTISPVHVEVRLSGWDVEVVDIESTSGTSIRSRRELKSRDRLRSSQPTLIHPGTEVRLGSRSFVFTVGPPPPTSKVGRSSEISWLQAQR